MTNKGWNVVIFIILLVLPFYSVTSIYQQEISQYSPISQEEMGFPATHWILMGLHDQPQRPGSYYADDVKQTEELKRSGLTNQELSNWHLEAIKERLEDYGVHGYLRFLNRKINFTWGMELIMLLINYRDNRWRIISSNHMYLERKMNLSSWLVKLFK